MGSGSAVVQPTVQKYLSYLSPPLPDSLTCILDANVCSMRSLTSAHQVPTLLPMVDLVLTGWLSSVTQTLTLRQYGLDC